MYSKWIWSWKSHSWQASVTANESSLAEIKKEVFVSIKIHNFDAKVHIEDKGSGIYVLSYTDHQASSGEANASSSMIQQQ